MRWDTIPAWIQLLISFLLFAAVLGAASIIVLSQVRKQRTEELQELAETRGSRIADLEKEVGELRADLNNVQGQLQAYQALKVQEIAVEVARMLSPVLHGRVHPDQLEGA